MVANSWMMHPVVSDSRTAVFDFQCVELLSNALGELRAHIAPM
jgi:hypothetical protein